jgi:hypothetical protein
MPRRDGTARRRRLQRAAAAERRVALAASGAEPTGAGAPAPARSGSRAAPRHRPRGLLTAAPAASLPRGSRAWGREWCRRFDAWDEEQVRRAPASSGSRVAPRHRASRPAASGAGEPADSGATLADSGAPPDQAGERDYSTWRFMPGQIDCPSWIILHGVNQEPYCDLCKKGGRR